jgi:hypothetical protein
MVRSHALYPIELRAHRGRIAFSNYKWKPGLSPNPRRMCESCMCPKPLPSSLLQGDKLRRFVNPSKSFRSQRKTYLPLRSTYACWQCLSNGNRHASPKADEVARNGAFGKILRPEVFPDAPLHFPRPSTSLSRLKPVPLSFPALPRESSPGMRIS